MLDGSLSPKGATEPAGQIQKTKKTFFLQNAPAAQFKLQTPLLGGFKLLVGLFVVPVVACCRFGIVSEILQR
jgi:hypothetical protein